MRDKAEENGRKILGIEREKAKLEVQFSPCGGGMKGLVCGQKDSGRGMFGNCNSRN